MVGSRQRKQKEQCNELKTYKTQNQMEKLCPTASCWLVVGREGSLVGRGTAL